MRQSTPAEKRRDGRALLANVRLWQVLASVSHRHVTTLPFLSVRAGEPPATELTTTRCWSRILCCLPPEQTCLEMPWNRYTNKRIFFLLPAEYKSAALTTTASERSKTAQSKVTAQNANDWTTRAITSDVYLCTRWNYLHWRHNTVSYAMKR